MTTPETVAGGFQARVDESTSPVESPSAPAVRVAVVQEADATSTVADLYAELRDQFFGLVPDVFKLVSTRPDMLEVLVGGYRSMFGGGHLSREVKEVIALTVARTASCRYCTSAHDTLLHLVATDSAYADAVARGALDDPAIPVAVRSLAELARDVTEHAYRVTDEDVEAVRAHGWSEAQFLEAVWVACVFNAIVRLADSLGLEQLGQLAEPPP